MVKPVVFIVRAGALYCGGMTPLSSRSMCENRHADGESPVPIVAMSLRGASGRWREYVCAPEIGFAIQLFTKGVLRRNSVGDCPVSLRNARLKCVRDWKPTR